MSIQMNGIDDVDQPRRKLHKSVLNNAFCYIMKHFRWQPFPYYNHLLIRKTVTVQ